jgi:hypothetical protein
LAVLNDTLNNNQNGYKATAIMIKKSFSFIIFLLLVNVFNIFSQNKAILTGTITDTTGSPIIMANIAIQGTRLGTYTDKNGKYTLEVPQSQNLIVVFTCIGYKAKFDSINTLNNNTLDINKELDIAYERLDEVQINARYENSGTIQRINNKSFEMVPNTSGNIETLLKTMPGVSSSNEMSSQYSVRGGSFDENLIYVNDVEIYRPFLVRSGQQEGLSFINPDLVGSLKFSAGGFDASYGDKMSSVLDVTYRKPMSNAGSVSASLLGQTFHYEGVTNDKKLKYLFGIRNKTSQYLLSSMDTKGEYSPKFVDAQTYISYDLFPSLELSFLGNYSQNDYYFVPQNRTTEFGTFQLPLQLQIYYEGKESDKFHNGMGSLAANYHPNENLSLKIITTAYQSSESETFDILGQYWINELSKGSGNDTAINLAVGSFLNHARNYMDVSIINVSHVGTYTSGENKLKWGLTSQQERIDDKLKEWDYVDSAGYSVPSSTSAIVLSQYASAKNKLTSQRFFGYIQYSYEYETVNSNKLYFTGGVRGNYWDVNNEFIFSPRASFSIKPNWEHDFLIYISTGFYHQPVFYKEMRNREGELNTDIKAQKSYHFVLGTDYQFKAWDRPFKLTTEMYYKYFNDLIPYKVENIRTQYDGNNKAIGYATGIDIKVNGEFVPGTESWVSLSLMRAYEAIKSENGNLQHPGYFPMPSDQLVNFSLFFQDYLPHNPSYKVHLSMHYGTGLLAAVPKTERYDQNYRMPAYQRVDIGFSKQLKSTEQRLGPSNPFRFLKDAWISAEIFNLLGNRNTMSYLWLKTVTNEDNMQGQFAVPNYLTSRRFNVKLSISF